MPGVATTRHDRGPHRRGPGRAGRSGPLVALRLRESGRSPRRRTAAASAPSRPRRHTAAHHVPDEHRIRPSEREDVVVAGSTGGVRAAHWRLRATPRRDPLDAAAAVAVQLGGEDVVEIRTHVSAGFLYNVALTSDGKVTAGAGTPTGSSRCPGARRQRVTAISAGIRSSYVLTCEGTIGAWGGINRRRLEGADLGRPRRHRPGCTQGRHRAVLERARATWNSVGNEIAVPAAVGARGSSSHHR